MKHMSNNGKEKRSSCPELFYKKGVLKTFTKFTGKHLRQRVSFLIKKRLWHRCFPMNFEKFLRAPFLTEHLRWLLLGKQGGKFEVQIQMNDNEDLELACASLSNLIQS